MSTMDEISYWVHTKRAPCLMNYDSSIKETSVVECSSKLISVSSAGEEVLPKKKKRKLSLLDDSASFERQQNVYFETSQANVRPVYCSKSESDESDIDFDVKNSLVWGKPKRIKLQKNSKAVLHKKNKVVTSTPNPKYTTGVRRSLRKVQNNESKNGLLDSSIECINQAVLEKGNRIKSTRVKATLKSKSAKVKYPNVSIENDMGQKRQKDLEVNNEFEEISDVSGFTANYIRSTKKHTEKTQRNLRSSRRKEFSKETQTNLDQTDSKIVVSLNKSVNVATELPTQANRSLEPSSHVLNLITVKDCGKNSKVDKSTSVLKFVEGKSTNRISKNKDNSQTNNKSNLDTPLQSTAPRYPKRQRNNHNISENACGFNTWAKRTPESRRKANNTCLFNDSDRKENPEELCTSRTRSGRNIGLCLRQQENSLLVYSNSTEQDSSVPNLNVACTSNRKKRKPGLKCVTTDRNTRNRKESLRRDSGRERSGFSACFSDSGESEPLIRKKFFC